MENSIFVSLIRCSFTFQEAVIGVEAEDYSPPPEAQRLAAELQ